MFEERKARWSGKVQDRGSFVCFNRWRWPQHMHDWSQYLVAGTFQFQIPITVLLLVYYLIFRSRPAGRGARHAERGTSQTSWKQSRNKGHFILQVVVVCSISYRPFHPYSLHSRLHFPHDHWTLALCAAVVAICLCFTHHPGDSVRSW